jgi:hypothetical protein
LIPILGFDTGRTDPEPLIPNLLADTLGGVKMRRKPGRFLNPACCRHQSLIIFGFLSKSKTPA